MDNPLTIKQISRITIGLSSDVFEMDTAYQTFLKNKHTLELLREEVCEKLKTEPSGRVRELLEERLNAQVRLVQYEWSRFIRYKEQYQKHLKMVTEAINDEKYAFDNLEAN